MKAVYYRFGVPIIQFFRYLEGAAIRLLTILAILAMFLSTAILIAFTEAQISMSLGIDSAAKQVPDYIFSYVGVDVGSLDSAKYVSLLSSSIGVVAVAVTLWFSFVTTIKYFNNIQEAKKHSIIGKAPVYEDGVDDLKVMLKYYKVANEVTVYSGDFSWVTKDEKLKIEVVRLASEQKISMISYKDESNVKAALNDSILFESLKDCFIFNSSVNKKCSLVRINNKAVFLYKVNNKVIGGKNNVCILYGRGDGEYLVESISSLCKPHIRT